LADHIIAEVLLVTGTAFFVKRKSVIRNLKINYYHKKECRISFACLLLARYENKFILIQNNNRPELFGPIGGVFKYYDSAQSFLDEIQFRPQAVGTPRVHNNFRGFIPIENLNKFILWFNKEKDREIESLTREIREELIDELQLPANIFNENPKFKKIKRILEGPFPVKGRDYLQYRQLDIFECVTTDSYTRKIVEYLAITPNAKIALVTSEEINKGRITKNKALIGSYCGFLIGNKRTGPEDTHYD
jgi:hypothetical protein